MYLYASWPLEDSNGLIASAASIMAHIALNDAARAILRSENLIANEPEIKEEKLGMGLCMVVLS